jgi:putative transposase
LNPSHQFNNLFIAHAKAFNKAYRRIGGLFKSPFKRKRVDNDRYFTYLIVYIHRNPEKHGLVDDFRNRPYSSYRAILSTRPSRMQRATVLDWFGGRAGFAEAHLTWVDESRIKPRIVDDWV